MINFRLFNDEVIQDNDNIAIFSIDIYCKINTILGDSGSGKSLTYSNIIMAMNNIDGWHTECNIDIRIPATLDDILNYDNTLVFLDEGLTDTLFRSAKADSILKTNNYFILMDRDSLCKRDTNVNAMFEIQHTGKVINGIEILNAVNHVRLSDTAYDNTFKYIITEDSASGRTFFDNIFSKISLFTSKKNNYQDGNNNVKFTLEELLDTDKNKDYKVLIALDYDRGAIVLTSIIQSHKIDNNRIAFIRMESFEEIICNSEFILDKYPELRDKVINYKNYIDATYKSTGNYFSKLLFDNVKIPSPVKQPNDRNYTIFYEKGMKNFKQCFIDNCCAYNRNNTECKLYTTENKKEKMLCNKFEVLRYFI